MKKRGWLWGCVISLLLASCGGGGEGVQQETGDSTVPGAAETTAAETTDPTPEIIPNTVEDDHMQLIPDTAFAGGIQILSQKDHANGDAVTVRGTRNFYTGGEAPGAQWLLAQWDSGPCLYENLVDAGANVITDGVGRTFAYDPETTAMTFALDTSLYYQGRPAVTGDWWPHLLIEHPDFGYFSASEEEAPYYRCDAEKMIVSFDIRLTDYSITENPEDWVEAAQFLMYFYVRGIETHDFCWFGLQLFDNRWERGDNYVGYDGGKADASGAMIYSIGSKHLYTKRGETLYKSGKPNPDMEFVHVEIDIKPYLEEMLALGLADGYFKAASLSELCINGMNLGWETIGTFDHAMEIKNLQLVSYR